MTKNNWGIYDMRTREWVQLEGTRLWKPTPYNTDWTDALRQQVEELAKKNASICLRPIPPADLREMGAMK